MKYTEDPYFTHGYLSRGVSFEASMRNRFIVFFLLIGVAFFGSPLMAGSQDDLEDPVKVSLHSEMATIQPGRSFWVAVGFQVAEGWHIYWKNPGDGGQPPEIHWQLPSGFSVGELQWPYPQKFVEGDTLYFGYTGTIYLLAEVKAPSSLEGGGIESLKASVNWLACRDSCVPGMTDVAMELPVKVAAPLLSETSQGLFVEARRHLPRQNEAIVMISHQNEMDLLLPSGKSGGHASHAFFFPEDSTLVSVTGERVVERGQKGYLVLPLSSDKSAEKSLKGVLVLSSATGEEEAFQIDSSLRGFALAETDSAEVMGLGVALLLALGGGFFLNFMPCVLPVIGMKIMGFVRLAKEDQRTSRSHGWAFVGGVLVAFWVLAAVLLAFRAYGESLGWGFQLQSPLFVSFLAVILLVVGLSLFGVFEMGTSVGALAGGVDTRSWGMLGSFGSGLLATAVATPCTGPFLGAAVGLAIALPPFQALLVFSCMGVGMAFPYLVLAYYPSLLRFVPKPGPWMVTFKEFMGFFMLASVLWLVWVFAAETDPAALLVLLSSLFCAGLAAWIYGKWATPVRSRKARWVGSVLAVALLLSTSAFLVKAVPTSSEGGLVAGEERVIEEEWIPFSSQKLAELRQKGVPVFVDFTAKWCLICQANKLPLHSGEVARKFKEKGVVKMLADWTKSDPFITQELRKFGRNGVPLYLFYGKDPKAPPQVLPQLLTPDVLLSLLEEMPTERNFMDHVVAEENDGSY